MVKLIVFFSLFISLWFQRLDGCFVGAYCALKVFYRGVKGYDSSLLLDKFDLFCG